MCEEGIELKELTHTDQTFILVYNIYYSIYLYITYVFMWKSK